MSFRGCQTFLEIYKLNQLLVRLFHPRISPLGTLGVVTGGVQKTSSNIKDVLSILENAAAL